MFSRQRRGPTRPPAVQLEVVDRATADLLRRLAESGVVSPSLRASRVLYPPPDAAARTLSPTDHLRAQAARDAHARRLKMAHVLAREEMTEEARGAVAAAIHELGRALAIEHRQPEPSNALGGGGPAAGCVLAGRRAGGGWRCGRSWPTRARRWRPRWRRWASRWKSARGRRRISSRGSRRSWRGWEIEGAHAQRTMDNKSTSFVYVWVNMVGWLLYVVLFETALNQMRAEERTVPDFGDSMNLLSNLLPLTIIFLIINIVWGVLAWWKMFPCREHGARAAWVAVVTVWLGVYLFMRYFGYRI